MKRIEPVSHVSVVLMGSREFMSLIEGQFELVSDRPLKGATAVPVESLSNSVDIFHLRSFVRDIVEIKYVGNLRIASGY
ncbi:hypothetical protein AAJ72_04125 [Citromicrobium sp. RCC1885]|nr:hypothetical protein AAJ72_04125 [Citromicrobium sp. RCC1885]KPM28153.1 hypothetical protein AAJ74_04870 [Citromicrobium sp. RCC1878]OAM10328.1 hypothetical protein A0U43_04540 [Citromicrobium sp. RCC1897]